MDEKAELKSTGSSEGAGAPAYTPAAPNTAADIVENKGMRIGEAADVYGDLQTAEEYGYVSRGLKSRHIQFIALGGTIGTGLFLGIGDALTRSGPLGILLGYTLTGIAVFALMQSIGEMATWLPLPGAIPQFCARYVDEAMGFAVGWNNWYSNALTLCAEISAAAVVINYWEGAHVVNSAVWVAIILVLVICLNIFAVEIYGEAEFCFASVKIITIIGLLFMAFIVMLGGGPDHFRRGFYYWQNPGALPRYFVEAPDPRADLGRFLAFFSTLVNAAFSYGGVEMVVVAAGEAENPRKNIPKAVRRTFWRILFFYVLGTLALGWLVPYNDGDLVKARKSDTEKHSANGSPWVIGIRNAGIPVLDSIINAVILTSASSSANAFLYSGSRYLYALGQNHQAPKVFLRCSKKGVPYVCVLVTASIGLLTFMAVSSGATVVFGWFLNLTTIATLFTWISALIAYLQFYKALKAQGIDRDTLVFKSFGQPYTAICALTFFSIIVLFNGFDTFSPFDISTFATAYIGIPIYFLLYFGWKVVKRTRLVRAEDADIYTGKAALDAADGKWPEQIPRNIVEKFWFWLA